MERNFSPESNDAQRIRVMNHVSSYEYVIAVTMMLDNVHVLLIKYMYIMLVTVVMLVTVAMLVVTLVMLVTV